MKELELIIQLVTQLSGDGKEAFIWWLLMDKGLGALVTLTTITIVAGLIYKTVLRFSNASQEQQNLKDIRSLVYPNGYSYYDSNDHRVVMQKLREKFGA